MSKLQQLYSAIGMLEELGLPVSSEQKMALREAENQYIEDELAPVLVDEIAELTKDIKGNFKLLVSVSSTEGVKVKRLEQSTVLNSTYTTKTHTTSNRTQGDKKKKYILRVKFPDGTTYFMQKVSETFAACISKIGYERVEPLEIRILGDNIITRTLCDNDRYRSAQFELPNGYYVQTYCDTDRKYAILCKINKELQLGLVIEKVAI